MPESKRTFRDGLATCAIAGSGAAGYELIRALSAPTELSLAYGAWCVLLLVAASLAVGVIAGVFARASPMLLCVPWLAGAGALAHGASGALAFAAAALALGALERRAAPPLVPWAVGIGLAFEASGLHADRVTPLVGSAWISASHAALLQHVLAFTALALLLTWLLGRARTRTAAGGATLLVVASSAAFAARDLDFGAAQQSSTKVVRAPESVEPSVLLIVLDTLRADHTSVYGYARETTPELARWLRERPGAQRFASAYANGSWTVPSHASLLSGQLPSVHGADYAGRRAGDSMGVAIAPEVPMLAELALKRGWKTFAVFANRWLKNAPGFRRGFETFERVDPRPELEPLGEPLRELLVPGLRAGDMTTYGGADLVREKLLARLDVIGPERFFGLVNFMDPHGPHLPMPGVAGTFGPWSVFDRSPKVRPGNSAELDQRLMDRYDEQILHLDRELGRLFGELSSRGILDRTWVIVVADHGEAFGEHGVTDHGSGVFDEIVHVPLIVFPPRGVTLAPSSRPVSQVDVAATIAAIAEVDYHGPGRDLRIADDERLVRIQHGGEPFRVHYCGELAGLDARAVIRGKWKLLDIAGALRLFDLEADPGETRDLAAKLPELVAELRDLLPDRMLQSTPVDRAHAPSSDERSRLRELGY